MRVSDLCVVPLHSPRYQEMACVQAWAQRWDEMTPSSLGKEAIKSRKSYFENKSSQQCHYMGQTPFFLLLSFLFFS